jgi:hypothetical protein
LAIPGGRGRGNYTLFLGTFKKGKFAVNASTVKTWSGGKTPYIL